MAFGCSIPTGISRTCSYDFGGIKKLYLGNADYFVAKKIAATNIVSGFTVTGSEKFYRFEFEPETGRYNEELRPNGSKFINQKIDFILSQITQAKREILEKVGLATIKAIVQKHDDTYFLFGENGAGLTAQVLALDSGAARTDMDGATVSLEGGSKGYANEVMSSALTSLLA